MATIVSTSEEEPMLAVVRLTAEAAWADAGAEVAEPEVARLYSEAQECLVQGRWVELASLMLASADLLLLSPRLPDKDLDCVLTVVCNTVTKAASHDDALQIAKLLCAKLTHHPDDKPALRLKILFNLYNLLESPYNRFFVYKKALEFAVAGKVTEYIIPTLKNMDSYINEWDIGNSEKRELLGAICTILKEQKSMREEHFSYLEKYLATFTGSDDAGDAMEEAVQAIIEFVKSPNIYQCDLLDLPAVAQLRSASDAKYQVVYELLNIFITQRLDSYLEFEVANSTVLKGFGLVHEDCITKMRLMSLLDLSSHCSGEIPYSAIRHTLKINDDEVEYWVVKAIACKILDCKVDQLNQMIIVSRHTERVFGMKQWQILHEKLGVWRANIASAISTIQANKVTEDGAQAMQGLAIR